MYRGLEYSILNYYSIIDDFISWWIICDYVIIVAGILLLVSEYFETNKIELSLCNNNYWKFSNNQNYKNVNDLKSHSPIIAAWNLTFYCKYSLGPFSFLYIHSTWQSLNGNWSNTINLILFRRRLLEAVASPPNEVWGRP